MDDAELNLDKVEEEMAADYSEEEEEEILHIDALQHVRKLPNIYSRNFIVELVPSGFILENEHQKYFLPTHFSLWQYIYLQKQIN